MAFAKNSYTDQEKEEIIAQAMETEEGRVSLAQAMVEPIRRALEYQACGRKTIMVDELPQGALARYERDPASIAHVIGRRAAVPEMWTEGEEVLVPTFEIAAHPTIRLSEIKARRFYIVDRAQIKAKEAIQKEEDTNIFTALLAAVDAKAAATPADSHIVNEATGHLTPDSLNEAFMKIEEHDLVATKVIVHARLYKDIRMFGLEFFDPATQREIISTGLFGHLWTADVHVSSRMELDTALIVASPDTVGAFPIRQDITVLPADDPKRLRLGWIIYEEVGIVIINDYSVAKVQLLTSST